MATEVIKIVDPGEGAGHDYHSLSLWNAGEQGDLTGARNEIAVAKCRATNGVADTTSCTISGWTTSATQYIKIWTDPAESYRHDGKYNTNKYRMELTNNYAIVQYENYVKIEGLQIQITLNTGLVEAFYFALQDAENLTEISNSIIVGVISGAGVATYGIYNAGGNLLFKIKNCLFYGWINGTNACWAVYYSTNKLSYFYNNTIVNCYNGAFVYGCSAKNNLASVSTNGYAVYAAAHALSDYNSTNVADLGYLEHGGGNANDRVSQTFTFVGAPDYHLASTDAGALDHGVDLHADGNLPVIDDIDGVTRSGTWDIGADEYVATVGPTNYPRSISGSLLGGIGLVTRKGILKRNQVGSI
jgi:hypothetical protein